MDSRFDETLAQLAQLGTVRDQFVVRAELLPADLALVGLYDELREAAYSAVELCRLHAQSAAFPLARIVFEATQQIIALATDDNYLGVGTRAWLFHRRKEKRIAQFAKGADAAREWYEQAIHEIQKIWSAYNAEADRILRRENAQLDAFQKNRGGGDNFMGRNLGKVVEERYPKLALVFGKSAAELNDLNSGIYAALSRESHARLRLDLASLRVSTDGTVTIVPRKVDEATKNELVLGCVSSSLTEVRAALTHLIESRRRARSTELARKAALLAAKPIVPGFKPDLGLNLMSRGGAGTTFHFSNVPVHKVGLMPTGIVSWTADIALADQETYAATFDIPQVLVPDLASALGVESGVFAPSPHVKKHILTQPATLQLECTLGEVQDSPEDAFVPLLVTKFVVQPVAPSSGQN